MLLDLGLSRVAMNVVQPAGINEEVKSINAITMENVSESIVRCGIATQAEVIQIAEELRRFAANPRTVMSIARVIQTWGNNTSH